jgi:hypothetical protein
MRYYFEVINILIFCRPIISHNGIYLKFIYPAKQENGLVSGTDFVRNIILSNLHHFGIFSSLVNMLTSIINLID